MKTWSIRWRIALWNAAGFAVVLVGFGLAVYGLLYKTHIDQLDRALEAAYQDLFENDALDGGLPDNWPRAAGFAAYLLDANGNILGRRGALAAPDLDWPLASGQGAPSFESVHLPDFRHVRRLIARSPANSTYTLVMLGSLHHIDEEMREVVRALLIVGPITLLVAVSISYLLARSALAPVDHLRRLTDTITAQRLDQRLPVANSHDELGLLAKTINAMIGRLEHSFHDIRRFTADASHELRTPVSVIRSEAELGLMSTNDGEAVRHRLESIVEECTRLASLTAQLLALCREDAGAVEATTEPLALGPLLQACTDSMRASAELKQQHLNWNHSAGEIAVLGDAERLRCMARNLIDNAIKYTPSGGTVSVALRRDGVDAVIEVTDTGIGIPSEHLPHIWDRFYQVNSGRATPRAGAGLGLSIVKSIVAAHGGRLEVDSTPGRGSSFRVLLPALSDPLPTESSPPYSAAAERID